jgi:hypothetical protein
MQTENNKEIELATRWCACMFLNSLKCNRLNFFQRTGLCKRRAEKLVNLLRAQSVLSKLNSYNFGAGLDYNFSAATKRQKPAR